MSEENNPENENPLKNKKPIPHGLPSELFTGDVVGVRMPNGSQKAALIVNLSKENLRTLEEGVGKIRKMENFSLSEELLKFVIPDTNITNNSDCSGPKILSEEKKSVISREEKAPVRPLPPSLIENPYNRYDKGFPLYF